MTDLHKSNDMVVDVQRGTITEQSTERMQFWARTLTGKLLDLDLASNDTVLDLKNAVYASEGIPADQMRIVFAGKLLADDDQTLADYGLQTGSTVHILTRLRGC